MSVTPQISLVAYESRDGRRVFVKVPDERGRYMLTDRCVVEVSCPNCRSAIGEPCKGLQKSYSVDTCYLRRRAYNFKRKGWAIPPPVDQMPAKPRYKLVLPKDQS